MPKYILGGKAFKSKEQIKKYFQKRLNEYKIGTVLEGEPKRIMLDLYKWHPEFEPDWINENIEFKTGQCDYMPRYNNFRAYNSAINKWQVFSYRKCVDRHNPERNHEINLNSALRRAIRYQIFDFVDQKAIHTDDGRKFYCEIENKLYPRAELHVDHHFKDMPFETLKKKYMASQQKCYKNYQLISTDSGHILNDEDMKTWQEFHQQHAKLRMIRKIYNLSEKKTPQ